MQPRELTEAMFRQYSPLAKRLALQYLPLLRAIPLVLDAILLRELQGYDASFPVERATTEARLSYLAGLSTDSLDALTRKFAELSLSKELVAEDWVRFPRKFEEDLSAYLWASHQVDLFRDVSEEFVHAIAAGVPVPHPALPRMVVVVLAPELHKEGYPLFRKLLPHGTHFLRVETSDAMEGILQRLEQRSAKSPVPYSHWYIDGGEPVACKQSAAHCLSWAKTEPIRSEVLKQVESVISSGSAGPEMLRSILASRKDSRPDISSGDTVFDAFVHSVYGEGAGAQIFSTTFVQWSARELLKRAQPATLVARFGPRQRQRGMNEMFAAETTEMDFAGSAMDADFGAYYTWINMQRLPDAKNAFFLACSLHDGQAVVVGPGFPRGVESSSIVSMGKLLGMLTEG